MLPSYMVQFTRIDPGKQTCLVRESDGSFLKFLWVFGPCIRSCKAHPRRVICVDGTHLAGKYFGSLSGLRVRTESYIPHRFCYRGIRE